MKITIAQYLTHVSELLAKAEAACDAGDWKAAGITHFVPLAANVMTVMNQKMTKAQRAELDVASNRFRKLIERLLEQARTRSQ